MIIKLSQPLNKNWLLVAEQLNDPDTWDRFVPTHGMDSERFHFDRVANQNGGSPIKLKACKDMLKRGTSAYEYDWDTDEDTIISHALLVADLLGVELLMDGPSTQSVA